MKRTWQESSKDESMEESDEDLESQSMADFDEEFERFCESLAEVKCLCQEILSLLRAALSK